MFSAIKLLGLLPLFFTGLLTSVNSTAIPVDPVDRTSASNSNQPSNDGRIAEPFLQKDGQTVALEKLVTPWLLFYTNQYRKGQGLDSLKYDDCLLKAAGFQSEYLFNQSRETHQYKLGHQQEPDSRWFKGKTPSDRALSAGCKKYCGENALYFTLPGLSDGQYGNAGKLNEVAKKIAYDMVYKHWDQSKGHRDNMLTKGYTTLGVSVAIGKSATGTLDTTRSVNTLPAGLVVFGIQVLAY